MYDAVVTLIQSHSTFVNVTKYTIFEIKNITNLDPNNDIKEYFGDTQPGTVRNTI